MVYEFHDMFQKVLRFWPECLVFLRIRASKIWIYVLRIILNMEDFSNVFTDMEIASWNIIGSRFIGDRETRSLTLVQDIIQSCVD